MFDPAIVLERVRSQTIQSNSIALLTEQFVEHQYMTVSKRTVPTRASHLKILVDFCRAAEISFIDQLSIPVLDTFFSMYGESRAFSTVQSMKRTVRIFSQWLIDYKEIYPSFRPDVIKVQKIKSNTPKALPVDQVLLAIKKSDQEDSIMIQMLLETGIRINELCTIRVCDVRGLRIHIFGKGGYERDVYMSKELSQRVFDFVEYTERSGDQRLFQRNKGWFGELDPKNARLRIQRVFKRFVGRHMTPHQLRHTFAYEMLKAKCDPIAIQRMLGHHDFSTTQIYLRLTDTYIEKQHGEYVEIMKKSLTAY